MISNLYLEQKAVVRVEDDKSEWFPVKKGVRQGSVLLSDLFSLYCQEVMNEIKDMEEVSAGVRNITNLRFADDAVILEDSEEKLHGSLDKLN